MVVTYDSFTCFLSYMFARAEEAEVKSCTFGYFDICVLVLSHFYIPLILFYVCKFCSHAIFMHFKEISVQSVIHNNNVFHFLKLVENKFLQYNEDP